MTVDDAEGTRLLEDADRRRNWKRWGPYLAERQWGTVREDYSKSGECWAYFPHDHARSRAYRWGEDGLLGICDREGRLCFALALWNGKDPILKERLFGLSGPEGNHGEDVKELYYYIDSTPTHSYAKALYKYPQAAFPYERLTREGQARGKDEPELEILDTGVFDEGRYFDVQVEYAKASPDDVLVRITLSNRGPERARLDLLPTLWFRNTWSWGRSGEGYWPRPSLARADRGAIVADHASLGRFFLEVEPLLGAPAPALLFTDNETDSARLFGVPTASPYTKAAFHEFITTGRASAVRQEGTGTKAAVHHQIELAAGQETIVRLRLVGEAERGHRPFDDGFDAVFAARKAEADAFYRQKIPAALSTDEQRVARQAYAGLLWSKQFYHFVVHDWLEGDPAQPPPPPERKVGRNREWRHLYNRDVISMPDKWEYPWYAAWDLAFHMLSFARIDIAFAKEQLLLFTREWYMHPNGQLPAYEFEFSDVNPPVHAWAAWRIYKMTGPRGGRDTVFLKRIFNKLVLNFNWWVNRKDVDGRNLFGGGFLGLDNIGIFDRSKPLPTGGRLEQADGTAWMAFTCGTMLSMALELARDDPAYEDMASKFFEHFLGITDAMNGPGGAGLWDEEDGFYYDELLVDGTAVPLRVRSMVGLLPLIAVEVLEDEVIERLPGFRRRMEWLLQNRADLARHISYMSQARQGGDGHRLLAIPSRGRLLRVLRTLLDEKEFFSPYGIRSLSRAHLDAPYVFRASGQEYQVGYVPGESTSGLFGGNSNWRGPIWFPVNYLIIEALERYDHFYGGVLRMECPTGSGHMLTFGEIAQEIARRLVSLFLPGPSGVPPYEGSAHAGDPHFRDLVLFHEYFHGDDGRGLGASHQTGWTALVTRCLEDLARHRTRR